MPQIKPAHRLYLYRLFKQELGVSKQTSLARAAEVLEADGLAPADVGCADVREMFEQMSECAKLTVFKKGAIFVTMLANEEYDRSLEKAAKGGEKSGGKSFKRKRGVKDVKPVKPKHVEPKAKKRAEVEGPVETVAPVEVETATEAVAVAMTEAPSSEANESQVKDAVADDAKKNEEVPAEAEPAAEPEAAAAEQEAAVGEAAAAEPAPAPKPASEPPLKPSINFTITYVPEPELEPEPEPEPAAEPAPAPAAPEPQPAPASEPKPQVEAAPEPEPAVPRAAEPAPKAAAPQAPEPATPAPLPTPAPAPAKKPARAHNDLPRDFYADVRCPDEQLSALYQVLPLDVDPVATLEEDFRIARSTGKLDGTRSSVSFPLRFERASGEPVRVTLRRTATAFAGKHWTLAEVSADSPEEVGFGALKHKSAGAWAAFANEGQLKGIISPEDALAQAVVLGSWDSLLDELAALAAPEDWGEGKALLREFLAMRWLRAHRQRRVSMADDGSSAAFDTGLLTAGGEPIGAILEPHDGDIIWELTCFSANAAARAVSWPDMPGAGAIADALLAQDDAELRRCAQLVARSPRVAAQAYDPVAEAVYALVPARGGALALDFSADEPRVAAVADLADARACARAVSSELPSWLLA